MRLPQGQHLAYCTNVHRGETWAETRAALETHVLPLRRRVAPGESYAIGLRLGARAAAELAAPGELAAFRRWLDAHGSYVFTINGFPYGSFHGTRVKEQVYAPDWATPERRVYTEGLFRLLAELVPAGGEGSVSTVPASFKGFIAADPARRPALFRELTAIARFLADLAGRTGRDLHLGLEPEPMCLLETTAETVAFFGEWREREPAVDREGLLRFVGVNYDCCHLAVEFEEPAAALGRLRAAGLRLSKLHL
ncbi:MAG: metabolite traffic protein EboE, partial [Verrucomicrobiota bacterium]